MAIYKKLGVCAVLIGTIAAAEQAPSTPGEFYRDYQPEAIIRELKRSAASDVAIMVPMRDGVGLDTNVYRPKDWKGGPLPRSFGRRRTTNWKCSREPP